MKVLFLIPSMFIPVNSGNKTLIANLLRSLQGKVECDLAILSAVGESLPGIEAEVRREYPSVGRVMVFPKCSGVVQLFRRVWFFLQGLHPALGRYYSRELIEWLSRPGVLDSYDLIHFDTMLMSPYLKFCSKKKTVLVASDAYSMGSDTMRRLSPNFFLKLIVMLQSFCFKNIESRMYPRFSVVCVVSERDANYLRENVPGAHVQIIGIGLPSEFVDRVVSHLKSDAPEFSGILCTGNVNNPVIADEIQRFVAEYLLLDPNDSSGVEIFILGKGSVRKLRLFVFANPRVTSIEYVDNYPDYLDRDWVYVYPQRTGTGLQTKVQQAMALGLPVIGFEKSFSALGVKSEIHCFSVNSHKEMAKTALALATNRTMRFTVGQRARAHVMTLYSESRVAEQMLDIYKRI